MTTLETDAIEVRTLRAAARLRPLRMNLHALGIEKIQTQVDWSQLPLLEFFAHEGFRPAARFCLEQSVERAVE